MKKPILCYVTDRKSLPLTAGADPAHALLECIEHAARAGVHWIQLREKDLDAKPLFELTGQAIAACASASPATGKQTIVLINDRLDIACAGRAAGVHLGEHSIPAGDITRWRSRAGRTEFLVGVSCHSLETAKQAADTGADYLFFGPVFTTPSKESFGAPQGLQKLKAVCRAIALPVLAIGGITSRNAGECLAAGAAGIAAIRLFQQAPDRVAAEIPQIGR